MKPLMFNRKDRNPYRHQMLPIPPSSLPSWLQLVRQQLETKIKLEITSIVNKTEYLPAATGTAAPAAGAAPAPDPMLEIKFLTSTPSRALAKRLGQYGSTSTFAAFKRVASFSP